MIKDQAIFNLYPSAVTVGNEGEFVLDKDQNPITIDETKVEEEYKKLKAEYDALQYQRDRAADYPSWQKQMDLLYHGGVDALKAELKKTKDKFPKPS